MLNSSNAQVFKCSNVHMFKCSNVQMTNVQVFQMLKSSYVQFSMYQCFNAQMFRCSDVRWSNIQMSKYLNVDNAKTLSKRTSGVLPVIFVWVFMTFLKGGILSG